MAVSPMPLDALPSEILIHVLESFPTRSLLPLAAVCQRFQALVTRIHYGRLLAAVGSTDHELILECYHPSAKLSTPYLYCDYLGTDGLEDVGTASSAPLGAMNELYSRYRPVVKDEDRRPRARYPTAGDGGVAGETSLPVEVPTHDVHLDACELFSQLCTATNLVRVGPRRGLFLSHVGVSDGVIRVWRDWLAREAAKTVGTRDAQRASLGMYESSILWADPSMNVGVRMRVAEKLDMRAPLLVGADDEPPVSYTLEYEELLVRTNHLVVSMEKSAVQEGTQSVTLQELLSSRPRPRCPEDHTARFSYAQPDWDADGFLAGWASSGGAGSDRMIAPVKMLAYLGMTAAVRAMDDFLAHAVETGFGLRDTLALPVVAGIDLVRRCRKLLHLL